MENDIVRILAFIVASTLALTVVIKIAASVGAKRAPSTAGAGVTALLISAIGIVLAKFGAEFSLPWQVYYTVPMLATVFIPPILFGYTQRGGALYILLAFATAPIIHAAFFYGLGWTEYMPFLRLPR